MLVSVIGDNIENIRVDGQSNTIDLTDFGTFVKKYMGDELYSLYMDAIDAVFSHVDDLESAIEFLDESLHTDDETEGEGDAR